MIRLRRAILIAYAVLGCGTGFPLGAQQTSTVRLSLPNWASTGRCWQQTQGGTSIVVRDQNSLTFSCPATIERLSCDINGAEPVDVSLAALCKHPDLALQPAASSVNLGTASSVTTVDWLGADEKAGISFVATRTFRPGERIVVPIAAVARRLVRVSRQGAAPVTVPSAALQAPEWRLSPATQGGEIVIQRSHATVQPGRYRLFTDGIESVHSHGDGDFLIVPSVQPGSYRLTPLYAGGVSAQMQKLRVEHGQTTFVFIAKEDVGGVAVKLHPAVCAESSRIQVRHLSIEAIQLPSGGQSTRTLTRDAATVAPVTECEPIVGGLEPGEYELQLDKRQNEAPMRRRFQVQADVLTEVIIQPAGTRLSGKITLNGRPLADAIVEFMTPEPPTQPVARGKTDERGNYVADFEKPGRYGASLRLRGVALPGEARSIEVPAGETTFDWAITGGTVTIRVENVSNPAEGYVSLDVQQITPPVANGRPGFSQAIRPDDAELTQGRMTFRAIGFGTYSARASQRPRRGERTRSSPEVQFSITEQNPDARVTLVLAENFGQIVLTDSSGTSLKGASIYMSGASAREIEPGTYSMDGIPAGAALHIRAAGFTPLCRLAPETSVGITLHSGRTVEVQFPGLDGKESSPWGWIQWSGSDCRIALDAFPFTKLPTNADGVPRFAVSNFPLAGDVAHSFLSEPARSYQVLYGVLVIPTRK